MKIEVAAEYAARGGIGAGGTDWGLCHWPFFVGYGFLVGSLAATGSKEVLGLAAAAITAFGRQKSRATLATSSGGLLSSGLKRKRVESATSTASALICWNFLKPSSPRISRVVGLWSKAPMEERRVDT